MPPPSRPWTTLVDDPRIGPVRLSGRLDEVDAADELVIVVHGLGGCIESYYAVRAAQASRDAGCSCLRLNLRGADRSGEDFYHAGLTADVAAAVHSAAASRYRSVYLLGYSMGGHVALRYATESVAANVRAVAAVCAPLDMRRSAEAFDRDVHSFYRRHVLRGLREIYDAVSKRREVPVPPRVLRRVRSIVEWDERTVAPRFGFRDAYEYYETTSVGPRLARLARPALLVASRGDPMIPPECVAPSLDRALENLDVRWVRGGGHVGFPPNLDLGQRSGPGLERQLLGWLRSSGRDASRAS